MKTISPDQVAALDEYEGEYGLTLITCTTGRKNRLVVQCRLIQ